MPSFGFDPDELLNVVMPQFRLRPPASEIRSWSRRYRYADTSSLQALGREAVARGWYTRHGLLEVARWKTRGRSVSRCEKNTDALVRRATAAALSSTQERERIEFLVELAGVGYPTASVLLHFAFPDRYPILDVRALWSLGQSGEPRAYSFGYWWSYVEACRSIAAAAHVSIRTLDRALWAYSKANQPAIAPRKARIQKKGLSPRRSALEFPTATYAALVDAAIAGRTLAYSELPGSRRAWGRDLFAIAPYEATNGRPPLTAIVVHKQDRRPGGGFAEAMRQVGYERRPGESDEGFWRRAVANVHDYWRGRSRPRVR